MNNTTLQLHVRLDIKWHHFQMASVLLRFDLQQVIWAVVYVEVPVLSVVTGMFIQQIGVTVIYFTNL
jgi:hypothetical protein